jgi:Glycosyltransferases involved in cell wall biogenesis
MKVAISAIAKDEIHNVEDFVASCEGADIVGVVDTGSTDGTKEKLEALGALLGTIELKSFRFDVARNEALDLLPEDVDVVVSIDLDERLQPG